MVKFKLVDTKYNIRDKIRVESIFKRADDKVTKDLLGKKHRMDKSLQLALNHTAKEKSFSDKLMLSALSSKITLKKK
jgi:hypothetical protein